jgi:hypothetical protein
MCKAFSCLVTRGEKVYWKAGVDSHEELLKLFVPQDINLRDDKPAPLNTFARVEITPPKGNYLNTNFDEWKFGIDEAIIPSFLNDKSEDLCRQAMEKWVKEVYVFNIKEVRNPINPFKIKPLKITENHIKLLKKWAPVWASVWASVEDSVWASVGASVGDSVWASVGASVGDSVGDSVGATVWASVGATVRASVGASVWAYMGSLFPQITEWKNAPRCAGYPYQSCVDLWKQGLVPSFDGKIWRLHGGGGAKVLWAGLDILRKGGGKWKN